jgi:hypothetical protein
MLHRSFLLALLAVAAVRVQAQDPLADLPAEVLAVLDDSTDAIFNDDHSTSSSFSLSSEDERSNEQSGESDSDSPPSNTNARYGLSSSGSRSSASSSSPWSRRSEWTTDNSHLRDSDSDDDDSTGSSSTVKERRESRDERRLEAAVRAALTPPAPTPAPIHTRTYQARFRTRDYGVAPSDADPITDYGPILFVSRRNFYLQDGGIGKFVFTSQDFLDLDEDGVPDIVPALSEFKTAGDSSEYFRIIQNRATKAAPQFPSGRQALGTINLVQFLEYAGRFSRLNEAVSQCFAVTSDPEFVLEVHVAVDGKLSSLPDQTEPAMLSATTVFVPPTPGDFVDASRVLSTDTNLFFDHDLNDFVEHFEVSLFANLLPDSHQPDALPVTREGTVFFEECTRSFSYFA